MFFVGIILGGIGIYLYMRPQLRRTQILDTQTIDENLRISQQNESLLNQKQSLLGYIDELSSSVKLLENQSKQAADFFYSKNLDIAKRNLEESIEHERDNYEKAVEDFKISYQQILEDSAKDFATQTAINKGILEALTNSIEDFRKKVDCATNEARRAQEIKEKADFYKLQITDQDVKEIQILRSAGSNLRNIEPLNKVIWKCYYEKPTTDLIGRVIGPGVHTGIYKITNLENQMCYVGQAVDLANRWKQHIKRGIGAEPLTRNKLYPAMMKDGVENFSFEVIEECSSKELNEKEKYWIAFYHGQDFGYNIKAGG